MKVQTSLFSRLGLILLLGAFGCTVIATRQLNEKYGLSHVRERLVSTADLSTQSLEYWRQAKPIIDNRCVVCHSCYDAPCQAKMGSPEGIDRGASKIPVYDPYRITADRPTRLGIDADSTEKWRKKGFFSVLNERDQTPVANLESSILYRLLELKRNEPSPETKTLPNSIDVSLNRAQVCPIDAELESYEKNFPLWGMPFGLPGLTENEFSILKNWLESGALMEKPSELSPKLKAEVEQWEHFFNGDSLKAQLVNRYLFEHLFRGDLYFSDLEEGKNKRSEGLKGKRKTHHSKLGLKSEPRRYFKLVRSKTPPGERVEVIPTRLPTDDPGVLRPYYRLVENVETHVAKTSMPYELNPARMKRLQELFLTDNSEVKALPGYDSELATNPFRAFEALSAESRYRFMLDDAEFFILGFMKGPVCRGQTALNVVRDQFWVLFVDPDKDPIGKASSFLSQESVNLRLPAERGSSAFAIFNWHTYASAERKYLAAKRKFLKNYAQQNKLTTNLDFIWDGGGTNPNAALTVFRNFDSASVVRGLVDPDPVTVWVMGYQLLERIHYLLTVDFDVFGNYGHQVLTRLYMDFLRIEAENNFLLLLPKATRVKEHANWYRGIGANTNEYAMSSENFNWIESGIKFNTSDPKAEVLDMLRKRMAPIAKNANLLDQPPFVAALEKLRGVAISFLPEITLLRIRQSDGHDKVFTLFLNRAHENVAVLYLESLRLLPEENTLSVYPGVAGAYPNIFLAVNENEQNDFLDALGKLRSEADYGKLLDKWGIRRTNPNFWAEADWFQQASRNDDPANGGLLDLNRFENR